MKINHPNLFKMIGYHIKEKEFFDGDMNQVYIYFEYFPFALDKEIDMRR